MATDKLIVEIEDNVLNKKLICDGWLKMKPMPQTPDSKWVKTKDEPVAPLVDAFPSVRAFIEDELANYVISRANKGLGRISRDSGQAVTKDALKTQEIE